MSEASLDVGVVSPEKTVFGSGHRDHRARVFYIRLLLGLVRVDALEMNTAELD